MTGAPSPSRRALELHLRPTVAELDEAALMRNFAALRTLAGPCEVLAMVKANAYGHGAVAVARALEQGGARWLGVALIEEGLELRRSGVQLPILVLGGAYEGGYQALVEHRLTPILFRVDQLEAFAEAASKASGPAAFHLKLDTGMGRIGLQTHELEGFAHRARALPAVRLEGVLSHFANADLADAEMTRAQVERFRQAVETLRAGGCNPAWRHLSNSAGVLSLAEVRDGTLCNLVRPGLALYGMPPAQWMSDRAPLEPVLSWKTQVMHLKRVPAGTPISYGGTWVARRDSVIATLPVGYADGYLRAYSNQASVLLRGHRAPIAGRVCMDLCMADVTDVPGASIGDEVVLLGRQGEHAITAHELANLAGTIPYEVLCSIGARVPRVSKSPGPPTP